MVDLNKGATVELVKALSDDIRTLPDGTKAVSAGAVPRQQLAALTDSTAVDLVPLYCKLVSKNHAGVDYTPTGTNSYRVNGTATASSYVSVYSGTGVFEVGKSYYVKCTTSDTNVKLVMSFFNGNNEATSQYLTSDSTVTVPNDTARTSVYVAVFNGKSVSNADITFQVLTALSNKDIDLKLSKRIFAKSATNYVSNNVITLGDIIEDGFYIIDDRWTVTDAPQGLAVTALTVEHFQPNSPTAFVKQIAESVFNTDAKKYYRFSGVDGVWGQWQEIPSNDVFLQINDLTTALSKRIFAKSAANYVSDNVITLGDIIEDGFYVIDDRWTVTDVPADLAVTALTVEHFHSNVPTAFVKQTIESIFNASSKIYYRFSVMDGTWGQWREIKGGTNYTFNNYENTYNVTATPTITSDSNQFLVSTGDTTDMTAAIVTMLTQSGVCRLGTGVFYVSGIDMPNDSMLIGSGSGTKIILNDNGTYAIKLNKNNKVENLSILGGTADITPSQTLGTRHGVLWSGNYTQTSDSNQQPAFGVLNGLWIKRFTGGGITCYDTGYGTVNFISGANINISNCGAGVNISYWSEFHKFTNVRTQGCYYGCVNNGGNNTFVNCDFSSCKLAFLIDNSDEQSPNNAHGSAVGCVFNHTDNNTGIGVKIVGSSNGYVFTGCQIFFSQIFLQDSSGIVFTGCNFGAANCGITISGGGAVLFANNMHQAQPTKTITNNSAVRFADCYVRSDGSAVS